MGNTNLFKEMVAKNILSISKNRLRILETLDISTYGSKSWAFTLQKIAKKKNKKLLYELGTIMGRDAAKEIKGLIEKKKAYLTEKMKELDNIIQISGFGKVKVDSKKNEYKITVENNQIINFSKEKYGENSEVCEFYRGVYSSFINIFNEKKKELEHTHCITKGDDKCIFEG